MSFDELQTAFPNGEQAPGLPNLNGMSCISQNTFCTVNVGTVAGVETVLQVTLSNGKVADAYLGKLSPSQFDAVVTALKEKFGKPYSANTGVVQNRIGGSFENPSFVWNFPDGKLFATKFMPNAPTLDISQVEISSTEWIAEKEAKQKARANDL